MGGQVRKGEKATHVLFYKFDDETQKAQDQPDRPTTEGKAEREHTRPPMVRCYAVFNVAHVRGDRAFYNLQSDTVTLPEREQFATANGYYQTALHELGHATGHPERMDRDTLKHGAGHFGSVEYAREELRAEMSAMMTGERVGVGHDGSRGAAYVKGWLKALEEDPKEIYKAAADAQKISDYLMRPIREREQTTDKEHGELAEKYSAARSPQISQTPPPQQPPQSHEREAASAARRFPCLTVPIFSGETTTRRRPPRRRGRPRER